jgi:hypothetical protein
MQVSVQIGPVGDTTNREISAATQDVRNALERVQGVSSATPDQVQAPEKAKGIADALGKVAVSLAPTAVKAALQALQAALVRQPATKVHIEYKDASFSFEFDPRKVSLQELTDAAERLRRAAEPA